MAYSSGAELSSLLGRISDGIVILDAQGRVKYINHSARRILGLRGAVVGRDCVSALSGGFSEPVRAQDCGVLSSGHQSGVPASSLSAAQTNGDFVCAISDFLSKGKSPCERRLEYTRSDGEKRDIRVSSSFLTGGTCRENADVVLRFFDETELLRLRLAQRESMLVFVAVTVFLCYGIFLYVFWELLNRPFEGSLITRFIELGGLLTFLFVIRNTKAPVGMEALRIRGIKKALITDTAIAAVGLVFIMCLKYVLMRTAPALFPSGAPFWSWGKMTPGRWLYPVTVVVQEFLTRGALQENLLRVFTGKRRQTLAVVVSSLIFSVLHIHKGLVYMICAAVLLGALGSLYCRQRTIWGLCIPHYVLGMTLGFLGFA